VFCLKVSELKSRTAVPEITLEVVSKGETREFANERGSGKVCSVAAKDETGEEVTVSLWNEQIGQVEEGKKIKIENGWCSEFQGNKQVSTGKLGKLTVL
jgi:replication factor A1